MTMPLDPQLAPVMAALFDAFPDGPPPPIEQTSQWWIEEIEEAAGKVNDFTWRTAPADVLDALYDATPWFSPELFVYWLPAFLVDIAVDNRRPDFRGSTIVYTLTKEGSEDLPDLLRRRPKRPEQTQEQYDTEMRETIRHYEERFRGNWNQMTGSQRAAVKLVLEYLVQRYHDPDYEKALARWPASDQPLP